MQDRNSHGLGLFLCIMIWPWWQIANFFYSCVNVLIALLDVKLLTMSKFDFFIFRRRVQVVNVLSDQVGSNACEENLFPCSFFSFIALLSVSLVALTNNLHSSWSCVISHHWYNRHFHVIIFLNVLFFHLANLLHDSV